MTFGYDMAVRRYMTMFVCVFIRVARVMILSAMTVGQAVALAPDYSQAKVAAARVLAILDRVPSIDTSSATGVLSVSPNNLCISFSGLMMKMECSRPITCDLIFHDYVMQFILTKLCR